MLQVFEHHLEAQKFAAAVSSIPARAALRGIHTLILEAEGLPLHFLPERYRPTTKLDVLFFYKAVERLFADWSDEIRSLSECPGNRDRLVHLPEAEGLISTLSTEGARVGLENFISILRTTPIPAGSSIDALFCSQLVSIPLSYPGLLERILSGEAEEEAIYCWSD